MGIYISLLSRIVFVIIGIFSDIDGSQFFIKNNEMPTIAMTHCFLSSLRLS
jgi:hypothetical protein